MNKYTQTPSPRWMRGGWVQEGSTWRGVVKVGLAVGLVLVYYWMTGLVLGQMPLY